MKWTMCRLTRLRGETDEVQIEAPTEHEPESSSIEMAAKEYVEGALGDAIYDDEVDEGTYFVYLRDAQGQNWRVMVIVSREIRVWSSGSAARVPAPAGESETSK